MLTTSQTALARGNAYDLLSRLFVHGLSAEILPEIVPVADLASHAPDPFDADEAEAARYRLFGFNVFPHESVFLGASSLLGGGVSAAVEQQYRAFGLRFQDDAIAADHVGMELRCLACLCSAEADAWQNDDRARIAAWRARQRQFLFEHLLRWLPALTQAIRQQDEPFYAALADLTLALALDHADTVEPEMAVKLESFVLPPPPILLEDPATGIDDISDFLLTPAFSGFYLSRDDISRLARPLRLPHGFGDRRLMLTHLLRAAVAYDRLPDLLDQLEDLTEAWLGVYRRNNPSLTAIAAVWTSRLCNTQRVLAELQNAGRQTGLEEPGQ